MSKIFLKNFSSRFIINLTNQLVMILIVVLMSSRLDIYSFGMLSLGFISYQFIYSITEWGFSMFAIDYVTNKKGDICNIFYTILFSKLLLFILVCPVVIFFLIFKEMSNSLIISIFILFFVSTFNNLWFFQATNTVEDIFYPSVISRFISLAFIFFFINQSNFSFLFLLIGIFLSIPIIYGHFLAIKRFKIKSSNNYLSSFRLIKVSSAYFFSYLSQNNLFTLWTIPAVFFVNFYYIGILNLCDQIVRAGNAISIIIAEVLVSSGNIIIQNKSFLRNLLIIASILFVFFISVTEFFINYIFSDNYSSSISFFVISLAIVYISFLTKIFCYPFIGAIYNHNYVNRMINFYTLCNIITIIIFFTFVSFNLSYLFLLYFFLNLSLLFFIFIKLIFR